MEPPPDGLDRMPPQAVDLERKILGACLIDRRGIERAMEVLQGDPIRVWYHRPHAHIWRVLRDLWDDDDPVDLSIVGEALKRRGKLDECGGQVYLVELAGETASPANVEMHCRMVMDAARARAVIELASDLSDAAYRSEDVSGAILSAMDGLYSLQMAGPRSGGWRSLSDALSEALSRHDKARKAGTGLTGVPWGLSDLDEMTGGMQPGEVSLLAARPGTGKTSLALQVVRHAALAGIGVGVVSLEMAHAVLGQRWLASAADVSLRAIRRGQATDEQVDDLTNAASSEANLPVWIDDTPGLTITEVRARCRALRRRHGVGLIVIDYLQLIDPDKATESSEREVAQISKGLQRMAMELDVPVLALCQLSRAPMSRGDKRPVQSDLRGSGGLEQDARVVVFLHRPEMHAPASQRENLQGVAEIIVSKQNNDETGTIKVQWDGSHTRFRPLAHSTYGEPPQEPTRSHPPREQDDQEEFL